MSPEERADALLSIVVRFMRPDLVSAFRQAIAAAYADASVVIRAIQEANEDSDEIAIAQLCKTFLSRSNPEAG